MRAVIGKFILVGAAGASVAWLASVVVSRNRDGSGEPASGSAATTTAPAASAEASGRPDAPPVAISPPDAPPIAGESLDDAGETGAAAIGDLPGNGVRDAPQRYPDDPASIEDLLAAPTIWCDFGVGNNQGIRIDGQLTTGGAAWVGDPLELDLLDFDQGTARLRGSLGATGSRKGEVKMRVIVDGARIHLMGLLPTGTLQTVTIYGDRSDSGRDAGRHVAVLSRHEPGAFLTYGVQYLGSCE